RDAAEHGELEASERRECAEWITRVDPVDRQRTPDDLDLPRKPGVVDSSPETAHSVRLRAEERSAQRRGRGRVSDPHLAQRDDTDPVARELVRELDALLDPCGR